MLAFHGEAPSPQTKLPMVFLLWFLSLFKNRSVALLSEGVWGLGEKDMSCHCFTNNRFSLNTHFLCKASLEPPVLFVSLNLKALECFLLREEMNSLNGRKWGQNESYLSYLVEHLFLIDFHIVLWCYHDVSFSNSNVLVLSNSKPSCSNDINQYVWLRVHAFQGVNFPPFQMCCKLFGFHIFITLPKINSHFSFTVFPPFILYILVGLHILLLSTLILVVFKEILEVNTCNPSTTSDPSTAIMMRPSQCLAHSRWLIKYWQKQLNQRELNGT